MVGLQRALFTIEKTTPSASGVLRILSLSELEKLFSGLSLSKTSYARASDWKNSEHDYMPEFQLTRFEANFSQEQDLPKKLI